MAKQAKHQTTWTFQRGFSLGGIDGVGRWIRFIVGS